jgi:lambda family phage tail tape measure protein
MPTNATLNIIVQEKGSRQASTNFKDMAKDIRRAGSALTALKKKMATLGGGGGGGGESSMARRVDQMIRAQDRIRAAMQRRADAVIKEFLREDIAAARHAASMASRVDRVVREQDRVRAAMRRRADGVVKEFAREDAARAKSKAAMARRVDSVIREQDRVRAAMRRRADGVVKEFAREDAALRRTSTAHKSSAAGARINATSTAAAGAAARQAQAGFVGLANQVFFLQRAFITLGGAFALRGFLQASDKFQNMENRLMRVTEGVDDLNATFEILQGVARSTRQDLGATVETFVRIRKATDAQGVTAGQVTSTLRTLNQMLAISGTTAQESEQAIRQLSQAFSKGKLDGDEFRTVSEAMPDILDAISASTGKTRGELRDMAQQGKITNQVLLDAFSAVEKTVQAEFDKSIKTLGQSWVVLKNAVVVAIGEFNKSKGVVSTLGAALRLLADNIWVLVAAAQALALWVGVKLITALIGFAATLPIVGVAIAAIKNQILALIVTMSLSLGPIGVIALAIGAFTTAAIFASGGIDGLSDSLAGLDAHDKSTNMLSDAQLHLKEYNEELVKTERRIKKFSGRSFYNTRQRKDDEDRVEAINKNIEAMQLYVDKLKGAAQQEIESAEAKKAREKLLGDFGKLKQALLPATAAMDDHWNQVNLVHRAVSELNLSEEQAADLIGELNRQFDENKPTYDAYLDRKREEIRQLKLSKNALAEENAKRKVSTELQKLQGAAAPAPEDQSEAIRLQKEIDRLRAASRGRKKAKSELDKLRDSYKGLVESLRPTVQAHHEFNDALKLVDEAGKKLNITAAAQAVLIDAITEKYKEQLDPVEAILEAAEKELELSKLSTRERERKIKIMEQEAAIQAALGPGPVAQFAGGLLAPGIVVSGEAAAANRAAADFQEQYRKSLNASTVASAEYKLKLKDLNEELKRTGDTQKFNKDSLRALTDLTPGLTAEVESLVNEYRKVNIQKEQFKLRSEAIEQASIKEQISTEFATQKMGELRREMEEVGTAMEGVRMGFDQLSQQFFTQDAINQQIASTMVNAYSGVEDALVGLVTTGKFGFKEMVDSMLADLTRLIIRMTILKGIESGVAGGGVFAGLGAAGGIGLGAALIPALAGFFRHGGSFTVGQPLPRFEHGGEFHVGGRGAAPDSQLVQFLASPGERVNVTNPGQSRLDSRNAAAQAAPPPVNITNVIDPAQFGAALSSPAGERAIINVVQQNAELFKKFIS